MIFTNGFVHCDPHPGNVLINTVASEKNKNKKSDFEIVLLDHGLYTCLNKPFRYNYARIWIAILEKDIDKLEKLTKNFNVGDYFGLFACIITGRSWDSINQGIQNVKYTTSEVIVTSNEVVRKIKTILKRFFFYYI
jgi:aarF domain-containing kinase